jgi:prolipoprotein diacylglyceryltransferase
VLATHFQPTFLYECLWDVGVAALLIYVDRRRRMGRGTVFLVYAMAYTAGRAWIEALRTDHANHFLGLRLNDWTSIVVFVLALLLFVRRGGFRAQREPDPYRGRHPRAQVKHELEDETQEEVTADARHDQ